MIRSLTYQFQFCFIHSFTQQFHPKKNKQNKQQKEDRIRALRQRLVEREEHTKSGSGNATAQQTNEIQLQVTTTHLAQGKDAIVVIQPEPTTASDFDSAIGGGLSIVTRTSQSDCELSESYL